MFAVQLRELRQAGVEVEVRVIIWRLALQRLNRDDDGE